MNKNFKVTMTQEGLNNPTVTIFENTLNVNENTITRVGQGEFEIMLPEIYLKKNIFIQTNSIGVGSTHRVDAYADSGNKVIVMVSDHLGQPADDGIANHPIYIEVLEDIELTPSEKSKLHHAKSILFGSGSENLIALAETL